jgi:hypothetical protein
LSDKLSAAISAAREHQARAEAAELLERLLRDVSEQLGARTAEAIALRRQLEIAHESLASAKHRLTKPKGSFG